MSFFLFPKCRQFLAECTMNSSYTLSGWWASRRGGRSTKRMCLELARGKFINGDSSVVGGNGYHDTRKHLSTSATKTANIKNLMWRKIYDFEIQILCDFPFWLVDLLRSWVLQDELLHIVPKRKCRSTSTKSAPQFPSRWQIHMCSGSLELSFALNVKW